jgi:predicted GNAT family N-acyltransferase
MHGRSSLAPPKSEQRAISIRIARDPNDLMLVTAIRSAVYLAEQDCPIEEEFDGNDLVAAHFIGFVGKEPAGCLRVRFFGEFAKVERLAVRHQFRRSRVSFKLVQASVEYVKRKGFRKIYGQAQDRLVDFWAHFGARPLGHSRKIAFSDFSYTEMVLDIEPGPDAITLDSDPYVIIRPEGDWDRPGVLDLSSGRAASTPLRSPVVAQRDLGSNDAGLP